MVSTGTHAQQNVWTNGIAHFQDAGWLAAYWWEVLARMRSKVGCPKGWLLYIRCWMIGRIVMVSTGTHVQENGCSNRIAPLQKMLVGSTGTHAQENR